MNEPIKTLLDFVSFTHEIRKVKRAMWVLDEDQFENDSEHGYQLALTALFVIEEKNLNLNALHAMGLALVHDVLEVHAGDTPVYGNQAHIQTQKARETEAIMELKRQWPQMQLMHELIDEYEARDTNESKFIYALDKLLPILNNYLDEGRNWIRQGVSLDQLIAVKRGKIDLDPAIHDYYAQSLALLRNKPEFFASN